MPAPRRLVVLLMMFVAACGDPPLCQTGVFVAIQTSQIVSDADVAAAGVQAEVRVRTSLPEGEMVDLSVVDGAGQVASTTTMAVDRDGIAVFPAVTVTTPRTTLRASARTVCGEGDDEVAIDVLAGAGCELALSPAPELNAHYDPVGVLSKLSDPDPATPGYQTVAVVSTRAGWIVELFGNSGAGEQRIGMAPADATGVARLPYTPPEGPATFRAICRGGDVSAASLATTVFVDTVAPGCAFTDPAPGSTITPAFDQNGDLGDGVQLAIAAAIAGTDVLGEQTTITVTPVGGSPFGVTSTPVDAAGASTAAATLSPPVTPASFELALIGRDHAGNTCTSAQVYEVVYNGCDISITSPVAAVTADANANPGDGSQVDVTVQVAAACVGRTVTSTCGSTSPSGVVPPGGQLVLRASVCSTSPCEAAAPCTVRVTTAAGVTTTASTTLQFDDQGPPVSLALVAPVLACGVQITPSTDADPGTDGVQIVARVTSPGAEHRSLELSNDAGASSFDATNDVSVTLEAGVNKLIGVGVDALANRSQTAPCDVTLADLSVSFSPPASDGVISRAEGTVIGNTSTFALCGTVNTMGAAVQLAIDGGAPVPAVVTGTTWCRTVTLVESPPSHTIVATATAGTSFGIGTLVVKVDLTPPPPAVGFAALAVNRQRIALSWQAPNDAGQRAAAYIVKQATSVLTDANFNTLGTVLPTGLPGLPGTPESVELFPARIGTAYWLGIATVDAVGNRSAAQVIGPITPGFDRTGAITAPDPSQGTVGLGYAIAHGKFNDDELEDVAIAAATQNGPAARAGAVYVYFGGPSLIAALPDLVITSTIANGRLGSGLAAVRWSSATRDDLVIGAPGVDGHGHLFVFRGGASFGTGTRASTSADLHVAVNPTTPGWFANGGLGSTLAAADVDGDGLADLIAAAPTGGAGSGGVAILYGGTVTLNTLLSDVDASGANGAIAELFQDPGAMPGRQLGFYLHAVGRTEGAADLTDDLAVVYADDYNTTGESLFVLRGNGIRPSTAGVSLRPFVAGRDVRLDFPNPVYKSTELGSQVASIEDQNGDGARDLVISAFAIFNGGGEAFIVDGNLLGTGGVATIGSAGVVLTTITGTSLSKLGAFVLADAGGRAADIDGDGLEDLMLGGTLAGGGRGFVWFGGAIPAGTTTLTSAQLTINAPATMTFARQTPKGFAGQARWVGDLDNDGLADVCWASPFDTGGDGAFEILAD